MFTGRSGIFFCEGSVQETLPLWGKGVFCLLKMSCKGSVEILDAISLSEYVLHSIFPVCGISINNVRLRMEVLHFGQVQLIFSPIVLVLLVFKKIVAIFRRHWLHFFLEALQLLLSHGDLWYILNYFLCESESQSVMSNSLWHSMQFSRPEYWSGELFHSPGYLPNPGIEPRPLALQADSLPAEPRKKPRNTGVRWALSFTVFQHS